MREIPATHRGGGIHGEAFSEGHADARLDVEQLPEQALFSVIRTSRVARRRTDAAITLGNQLVVGELLVTRIAPQLFTHALMQTFGEGFRQAISERLGHDRRIVIVLGLVGLDDGAEADTSGDRERTHVVMHGSVLRRQEIGQRKIRLTCRLARLLAQRMHHRQRLATAVVGEHRDVFAVDRIGREQTDHGARFQQLVLDKFGQHALRIGEHLPRLLTDHFVVEDARILAGQLPGHEERRPVDEGHKIFERIVSKHMDAGLLRRATLVAAPIGGEAIGTRLRQGH